MVAGFQDGKLSHEHIYWDQASLLVQVGLLDPGGLPVVGAEQAGKLLVPRAVPANALPQLPATAEGLWLATPPTVRKIEAALAQWAAEALAPRVLIGRSADLAALEDFTSSGTRWRWIQGDAFAGKTALMAWFTLHPPERVDIAACFLRRASGEDTADYALDVLTRRLALLVGSDGYRTPRFSSEQVGNFAALLEEAARACAERGRQLVVLIDGLDEYDPTTASLDLADWLPGYRTLPDQAMLLAASRAGADVRLPSGHPLSRFVQRITASEAATEIQQAAHAELDRAVRTPGGFLLPLLCCLAVAGSGLTASDMCALLKRRGRDADVSEIEIQLSSSLGRSLIRLPHPEGTGKQAYAFAHDTLLTEARSRFASDPPAYENLLDGWASEYADDNWPDGTPRYLLAPYTRELARRAAAEKAMSRALDRLSALARSPSRHAFLLRATGSDYTLLTEIRTAQSLLADQKVPDLEALVELAVYRHAISIRNQYIPFGLPAAWALLGRFDHAEALARTFTHPGDQARVLSGTVTAIAQAGDFDRAEALARTIASPDDQARALANLMGAAAQAEDRDRVFRLASDAEALARAITDPDDQARALANLMEVAAQAGDPDRAYRLATAAEEALARIFTGTADSPARAYSRVATAIARAGDFDRAEALARTITDPDDQAGALANLMEVAAQAGDSDRVFRLANDAEALARAITGSWTQARACSTVATAITRAGDFDRAEALARTITDPHEQFDALFVVATAIAKAGDSNRAFRLANDAEALPRTVTIPWARAWRLTDLATAIAQAGDPDRAEALAHTLSGLNYQAQALSGVATATAQTGDSDRAELLARTITTPHLRAEVLSRVAMVIAQAGDHDRAFRLAADVDALARTITDPGDQARDSSGLATAMADPYARSRALSELAMAIAQAGDSDGAESLARTITDPYNQARALSWVATAIAQAGDLDRAEALARAITDERDQAWALANLVKVAAKYYSCCFTLSARVLLVP